MTPTPASPISRQQQVRHVLALRQPQRIVYAPNYWQWFSHHRNHGLLPPEMAHCRTQLDLIRHLGLDVFSRKLQHLHPHALASTPVVPGRMAGIRRDIDRGIL
jgi:hypothetical protein